MQVFSPIPEDTFGVLWGRLAALVGLWCAYLGPKHSHAASCICECRNKRLRRSGIVFMLPTRGKLSGLFYSPLFLCFLFLILLHFFLLIPPPPPPPLYILLVRHLLSPYVIVIIIIILCFFTVSFSSVLFMAMDISSWVVLKKRVIFISKQFIFHVEFRIRQRLGKE